MFDFLIGMTIKTMLGCLTPEAALAMDVALETDNRQMSSRIVQSQACGVIGRNVDLTVTAVLDDEGKYLAIEGELPNGRPFWTHMTPELARAQMEEI
jgi:hypothetical protein